jgi:TolB-like protein/Tfp pilus assembly protein PilF
VSLIKELQRRSVFKVGAAYLVVAWLAAQAAGLAFPAFEAPAWALRVFLFTLMLGFPVALVMAWVFDVTPEGVKLELSRGGDTRFFVIVGAIALLAVGWYFYGQASYKSDDPQAQDGPPSVAVLPFANLSGDPAQEFFSDGMTEEILNVLVKIPDLKVAARTSVFAFKGQGGDVREIGKKLGVSHIVEGSVRRDGAQIRITAQLIRVTDGFHVWSETYDREVKSVFAVQDEIAKKIAGQLKGTLAKAEAPVARTDIGPAAYEDYLKARKLYRARGDMVQAIALLRSVVEREPGYAPAWATLSLALEVAVYFTTPLEREVLGQALPQFKQAAAKAVALDPGGAMTLHALANVARGEGRFAEAEDLYRRSVATDPTYPDVREDLTELLTNVGKLDAATAEFEALIALEPYAWIFMNRLGALAVARRDPELAEQARTRVAELSAGRGWGQLYAFRVAAARGDHAAAKVAIERAWRESPSNETANSYGLWLWSQRDPSISDLAARQAAIQVRGDATFTGLRGDEASFFESVERLQESHTRYNVFADLVESPRFLSRPRAKQMLRDFGFEAYWRERGWPEQCKPLGASDFECRAVGLVEPAAR